MIQTFVGFVFALIISFFVFAGYSYWLGKNNPLRERKAMISGLVGSTFVGLFLCFSVGLGEPLRKFFISNQNLSLDSHWFKWLIVLALGFLTTVQVISYHFSHHLEMKEQKPAIQTKRVIYNSPKSIYGKSIGHDMRKHIGLHVLIGTMLAALVWLLCKFKFIKQIRDKIPWKGGL